MITIKITNSREIVATEKGRLVSHIAPLFVNLERKVEEEIVREIDRIFRERNIQAIITIVDDHAGGA